MRHRIIYFLFIISIYACSSATSQELGIVKLEEKTLEQNGKTINFDEGVIALLENHNDSSSSVIKVPFKRIKTVATHPFPPIFLLEGGPANNPSALQQWNNILPLLSSFTAQSDLIVIEQRGNGNSSPNLQCPGSFRLPLDQELSKPQFGNIFGSYIKSCEVHFKNKGIETKFYNVVSMSHDVDALRDALGYKKLMLFGGSFGSHWALNYAKLYPENVDRILIDSPEGFNHSVKLPSYAEQALRNLDSMIKKNDKWKSEFPEFYNGVKRVLKSLEEPRNFQVGNSKIVLGKYDLQLITALDLGRSAYQELPFQYKKMLAGDFTWFAERSLQMRSGLSYNLMAVISDCTSGANKERWETIKSSSNSTLLGDALNNVNFEACALLDLASLSVKIQSDFINKIPTLIVVGSQDARTPYSNALEIVSSFQKSKVLEVKNASHDVFQEAGVILFPILKTYLTSMSIEKLKLPSFITYEFDLKK